MSRTIFSPLAKSDLQEIVDYISLDNVQAAQSLFDQIQGKCRLLAEYSGMGRLRKESRDPTVRSFPVGNYVIFYRPVEKGVEIVRVLHGAQDIESLL